MDERGSATGDRELGLRRIGVVGLGYVGLPLLLAFSRFADVVGVDANPERVHRLGAGGGGLPDVDRGALSAALARGMKITGDPDALVNCTSIVICVPTPVAENGDPDLSHIEAVGRMLAPRVGGGQLIVLESTTYPGTTREVLLPILESQGKRSGRDFWLAYSPERIDPGNPSRGLTDTAKLVGGIDDGAAQRALALYSEILDAPVIKVSSAEVAEAAKILENVFRNVNIALINEMAQIFDRMGLNTWEIVKAASTKPYGFMAFAPGPGVGGHCIPVDPLYLSYRAKQFGFHPRFIELGHAINSSMPIYAVDLAQRAAWRLGFRSLEGCRVSLMGVSYKKGVADVRESPSLVMINELVRRKAVVTVHDPRAHIPKEFAGSVGWAGSINEALRGANVIILAVDHEEYVHLGAETIFANAPDSLVVDCRNVVSASHPRISGIGKGGKEVAVPLEERTLPDQRQRDSPG